MNRSYRVHVLAVVRVPVDVEATTPLEAAALAHAHLADTRLLDRLFGGRPTGEPSRLPGELTCEYNDEIVDYLVDEADDPEHERSVWVTPDEIRQSARSNTEPSVR